MSDVSDRLAQAVDYIKRNGSEKSDSAIARKIGITYSAFCMAKKGYREPTAELLLKICDNYDISVRWLRTGKGSMMEPETVDCSIVERLSRIEDAIDRIERYLGKKD